MSRSGVNPHIRRLVESVVLAAQGTQVLMKVLVAGVRHSDLAERLELVQSTDMPQVAIRTRALDEVSAGLPRMPDRRDRADAGCALRSAAPSAGWRGLGQHGGRLLGKSVTGDQVQHRGRDDE